MIVTCEECSTSFQLDESRIPATGAQVRCSRCKHAFFLANPSASQAEVVDAVASEAASSPEGLAPSATADLSASPDNESLAEPDLDEEEWQFSEEVRIEGDEPDDVLGSDFGETLDSDAFGESAAGEESELGLALEDGGLSAEVSAGPGDEVSGDGLQIANDAISDAGEGSGLELDSGPEEEVVAGRDASSFGSVDDFSELMEDDDTGVAVDLTSDEASEMRQGSPVQASAGVYTERGQSDDLGDPESWDLVGSDDLVAGQAALRSGMRAAGAEETSVSTADFFGEDEYDEAPFGENSLGAMLLSGPVATASRLVGWAAATMLVGWVAMVSVESEWAHWAQTPQQVRSGPLSAATTESGWVETSRAGPVLRFAGELRNTSNQPVWPGSLQLQLLDATGERIAGPSIMAGAPLPRVVLREAPASVLLSRAEAATGRLVATPLAPGEVRPFEALLLNEQLPGEARRIALELIQPEVSAAAAPAAPVSGVSARSGQAGQAGQAGIDVPSGPDGLAEGDSANHGVSGETGQPVQDEAASP